jgi:hypothetical protein
MKILLLTASPAWNHVNVTPSCFKVNTDFQQILNQRQAGSDLVAVDYLHLCSSWFRCNYWQMTGQIGVILNSVYQIITT